MAEGDKITTTSSMQSRDKTQETPQQVRLREARVEAEMRQFVSDNKRTDKTVDVAAIISNIDDHLDAIGQETLKLSNSDELASFLNHVNFAKVDLLWLSEVERTKVVDTVETNDD